MNLTRITGIGEKSCQRHIILSELWIRDECLGLDVNQWDTKVQGLMLKSITLLTEQARITILPFDEKSLDGDMEIIAGNACPDNNVEIAYVDQHQLQTLS